MCNFKPRVILNIDEVWDIKRKTFEIFAAQTHLWAYYEPVALQRGHAGRAQFGHSHDLWRGLSEVIP